MRKGRREKKDDEGIYSKKCEQYDAVQNVMDGWCAMNGGRRKKRAV